MNGLRIRALPAFLLAVVCGTPTLAADETTAKDTGAKPSQAAADDAQPSADPLGKPAAGEPGEKTEKTGNAAAPSKFGEPPGAKRLVPGTDVWVDAKRKLVILDGEVCLTRGPLEMFICLARTKEHESVIAAKTKAFYVHAALLSVGAETGNPVSWDPKYVPASGTEIDIFLLWYDKQGKKRTAKAQEWIRDAKTGKPMAHNWVFAGSGFYTDEITGEKQYLAEGGDFICVSNFPSAMLDLPVESTQANQGLLFDALTENIPEKGTQVRIVLRPRLKKPKQGEQAAPGKDAADAPKPAEKPADSSAK